MPDPAGPVADPADAHAPHLARALAWRPQRYGRKGPHEVRDALVEPLWTGPRVLVAATPETVTILHDGEVVPGLADLHAAIPPAVRAETIVVEGILSQQALGTGEGAYTAPESSTSLNPLRLFSRLMMPGGRKREQLLREREEAREASETRARLLSERFGEAVAFVATDLLYLDGDELLDVPLLERKRLLESALAEGELVRRSAFVRPSAGGSLIAWKAIGFAMLAYKSAGSTYRPGEVNDAWATAPAPSVVAAPTSRAPT